MITINISINKGLAEIVDKQTVVSFLETWLENSTLNQLSVSKFSTKMTLIIN